MNHSPSLWGVGKPKASRWGDWPEKKRKARELIQPTHSHVGAWERENDGRLFFGFVGGFGGGFGGFGKINVIHNFMSFGVLFFRKARRWIFYHSTTRIFYQIKNGVAGCLGL